MYNFYNQDIEAREIIIHAVNCRLNCELCTITGTANTIIGNANILNGNGNTIIGNDNIVTGKQNTIINGKGNILKEDNDIVNTVGTTTVIFNEGACIGQVINGKGSTMIMKF